MKVENIDQYRERAITHNQRLTLRFISEFFDYMHLGDRPSALLAQLVYKFDTTQGPVFIDKTIRNMEDGTEFIWGTIEYFSSPVEENVFLGIAHIDANPPGYPTMKHLRRNPKITEYINAHPELKGSGPVLLPAEKRSAIRTYREIK